MAEPAKTTAAAGPNGKQERQRGPVEEVIAKRCRQVGKKLQRIKAYAAIPIEKLNADQKAALGTLSALEATYKELEDLIREKGPVDEQELIQAAKLREAQDSARAQAEAATGRKVETFKSALAGSLSRFLRLRSLLHPARPSDHEHLTFGHLTLPAHLQDEVQATDILRVGRMWDELISGEESAKKVLDRLANGPAHGDEEDEHVHHLLHLLSQPEPESASNSFEEEQYDDSTTSNNAPVVFESEMVTAPPSVGFEAHGSTPSGYDHTTPEAEQVEEAKGGGMINFLQEDELDAEQDKGDVNDVDVATEHSFEVVPMLEPHQTSGQQPPVEEPVTTQETPSLPSSSRFDFTPQLGSSSGQNWADLDQEDEVPTTAVPASAEQTAPAEPAEAAPATASSNTQGNGSPVSPLASSSRAPLPPRPNQRPSGQGKPHSPKQKFGGQSQQSQAREPARKTTIDEDGFETVVKRGPPPVNRGRGRGGGGGRGDGRGRGSRGGFGGRPNNGSGEYQNQNGHQDRSASGHKGQKSKDAQGQGQGQGQKPSIYKSVQPTGAKAAPLA